MARNIVLLFDGTWNDRKDKTNVLLMRESIDSRGQDDPQQPCRYLTGVGTSWQTWLTGGLFGRGLSENIQEGYAWLARKYHDAPDQARKDDRIFVLGFSRGAYTARSCVGLIRKCGLLKQPSESNVQKAYELYRNKDVAPDDPAAVDWRRDNSTEARVRFIGVWDTVGALGIPVSHIPFSSDYYRWHDTRLSKIVDYAYHAIAVDERRKEYSPAVWTERKPDETLDVEQRWFIGAHSNVGGGYDKRPTDFLSNITLRWMQDKAEAAGLKLVSKAQPGAEDCMADINNSYRQMAFGAYTWVRAPFDRPFGEGVNEVVDATVWTRWRKDPGYRPASMSRAPERPDADDADLSAAHPG